MLGTVFAGISTASTVFSYLDSKKAAKNDRRSVEAYNRAEGFRKEIATIRHNRSIMSEIREGRIMRGTAVANAVAQSGAGSFGSAITGASTIMSTVSNRVGTLQAIKANADLAGYETLSATGFASKANELKSSSNLWSAVASAGWTAYDRKDTLANIFKV